MFFFCYLSSLSLMFLFWFSVKFSSAAMLLLILPSCVFCIIFLWTWKISYSFPSLFFIWGSKCLLLFVLRVILWFLRLFYLLCVTMLIIIYYIWWWLRRQFLSLAPNELLNMCSNVHPRSRRRSSKIIINCDFWITVVHLLIKILCLCLKVLWSISHILCKYDLYWLSLWFKGD